MRWRLGSAPNPYAIASESAFGAGQSDTPRERGANSHLHPGRHKPSVRHCFSYPYAELPRKLSSVIWALNILVDILVIFCGYSGSIFRGYSMDKFGFGSGDFIVRSARPISFMLYQTDRVRNSGYSIGNYCLVEILDSSTLSKRWCSLILLFTI